MATRKLKVIHQQLFIHSHVLRHNILQMKYEQIENDTIEKIEK